LGQPEKPGTKHRRQRQSNERRDRHGEGHGQPKLVEEPADQPFHKRHRNEHRHDGQRGCDHREADLRNTRQGGLHPGLTFFHVPVGVLQHHDRIVDHHPYRDAQRQHGDHVQREAHGGDEREGGNDRGRDRHGRDKCTPQVAQKEENHEYRQAPAAEQFALGGVEAVAHEEREILDYGQLITLRQAGPNLVELGLDRIRHGQKVFARLSPQQERDGLLAVEAGKAAKILLAVFDQGHVADTDRCPVAIGNHQILKLLHLPHVALRANHHLAALGFDPAAGKLDVFVSEGIDHVLSRKPTGAQVVDPQPDADLAVPPAHDPQRPHAFDSLDARLDLVVCVTGQLPDRRRPGEHDRQDRSGVGVELLHHRGLDLDRQIGADRGDLVADVLRRHVDVALQLKLNEDLRQPFGTLGPQRLDAADRVDCLLDHVGNFALDGLGVGAFINHGDGDDGKVDVGKQAKTQPAVGSQPEDHQRRDEHQGKNRTTDAEIRYLHVAFANGCVGEPAWRTRTAMPSDRMDGSSTTTCSPSVSPESTSTAWSLAMPKVTACCRTWPSR
jgi:hypothetical protein